ncbi:60S ribosomal protein L22 [Coemansia sp. RSA 552]|nr:60S ribosomal protein L22 [Coemansia sp. RSA 552]
MAPQKTKVKRPSLSFVIDVSTPAADKIFDVAAFEKFLHDRFKVQGRTNNLGDSVKIARQGDKITVESKVQFPKRYLKYLTKKFLKKNNLREYIRVVADAKGSYELRYFNVDEEAGDNDEDEE